MATKILPQKFYQRSTKLVARSLLGKILCRRYQGKIWRYRIVETEAYLGISDKACHTFGGRKTKRVSSMYLDGGHSYIYLIYGMYHCLNVVTRTSKHPEAVLIRGLEPLNPRFPNKTNGPGKLCKSLNLSKKEDAVSLLSKDSGLWIEDGPRVLSKNIVSTSRVGVDYAEEAAQWPLRFYILANRFVSKK